MSNRIVKLLSASCAILLFSFFLQPKSIYTIPFNDINNQKVNLFPYMGKKMVFITLSGKEADSTLEQVISAFFKRYKRQYGHYGHIVYMRMGIMKQGRKRSKSLL